MPRIFPVDYKTLLKVFQIYGCKYKRKEGSHHILIYPGAKRAVVIPEYDEIDVDIPKSAIGLRKVILWAVSNKKIGTDDSKYPVQTVVS